jgi:hypothetical protein
MASRLDDVAHTSTSNKVRSNSDGLKVWDDGIAKDSEHVEQQYIHGIRLNLFLAALTLVLFLSFLDLSIIATVCIAPVSSI